MMDGELVAAARDRQPVQGLTHNFYRYPARFSPRFARAALEAFSEPGQLVLDPFMGGGTTIVEGLACGRRCVGSDVNSLSVFVTGVKTRLLKQSDYQALRQWSEVQVPALNAHLPLPIDDPYLNFTPKNLHLPEARFIRKTIALCLGSLVDLPSDQAKDFARCVVLNVGQWALNGRRESATCLQFRDRISSTTRAMLEAMESYQAELSVETSPPNLLLADAETLPGRWVEQDLPPASLVVTSPPYPGVHVLYHRWQVDGRKETDAPYWITNSLDGHGASYYNFADRKRPAEHRYFAKAESSFIGVRSVLKTGARIVQVVAFSEPRRQLPRYLSMLQRCGFREDRAPRERRLWRSVPGRKWHANLKGDLPSAREVVLVHRAT